MLIQHWEGDCLFWLQAEPPLQRLTCKAYKSIWAKNTWLPEGSLTFKAGCPGPGDLSFREGQEEATVCVAAGAKVSRCSTVQMHLVAATLN